VEPPPPAAEQPATPLDLARVTTLWPAVADAIREQNGMVAALLAEAVPTALEGSRLTIQFPADAAFSKKKAEANRELVTGALRSLGGHAVAVAFELGEDRGEVRGPATLTADELAERLLRDFDAEEIFESDESESED
jgi:uncharacterized surface protein with fasciclin (FAS1) repeats